MEKKNAKLKNTFTNLISHISKMYKEVSNVNNEGYLVGRKEAFEEILNWFVTSHNGELKYISASSFFNMIQEKIAKTKAAIASKVSNDEEEEIKPTMNFSEIKISDNRKRVNRYAQSDVSQGNLVNSNDQMEEEVVSTSANSNMPIQTALNFSFSVNSLLNGNSSRENFIMPTLSNLNNINNLNDIQSHSDTSSNLLNNQTSVVGSGNGLINFTNQNISTSNTSTYPNPFVSFGLNNSVITSNPIQQTTQIIQPSLFNLNSCTGNSTTASILKKKKK
jgi:hypothetical protein